MLNYAETTSGSTNVPVMSDMEQTVVGIAQKLHHEGKNVTAVHGGDNQWKITCTRWHSFPNNSY